MDKYLVYTNITGSSDVPKIESFLNASGYLFDYEPVYHGHHVREHSGYIRCFALIDTSLQLNNQELFADVMKRCETLHAKNVNIVLCNFWESIRQIKSTQWYNLLKKFQPLIWHGGLSFFWHLMHKRYKNQKFKFYHTHKNYDFLYLNKTSRPHRELLFSALYRRGLLDNSIVSFHAKKISLDARFELPWLQGKPYPAYGRDRDIYEEPYNQSIFNIVSETSSDEKFFTEKIWKPILAKQPFVVHGKQGYLQDLQSLGFKTYNAFIDESYDSIKSLEQRTDAIVRTCEVIKNTLVLDPIKFYYQTRQIREHNNNVFFSEQHVEKAVRRDVSELLEFADSS